MVLNGGPSADRGPRFAAGAVATVAARELRRWWRPLLAIGVGAGVLGAVVVAALAVARRTWTAYDRLVGATAIDDARAYVFVDDPHLPARMASLPGVEKAWIGGMVVARIDGPGVHYVSILAGPPRPAGLFAHVLIAGRAADPSNPTEVVAAEGWVESTGVSVGDVLRVKLLTAQEFHDFDVGFGEPDGPPVEVKVVGVVRLPAPDKAPLYAGPAFAAGPAGSPDVRAASVVRFRLRDGEEGLAALRRNVATLSGPPSAPGPGEFLPVEVNVPGDAAVAIRAAARVLVGGLGILAAVATLAGALAVAQAFARHHEANAADQHTEAALGLTRGERAAARMSAAVVGVGAAAVMVTLVGIAAGTVEPLGAVAAYEPHPGFAPNVSLAVLGATATGMAVATFAGLTAWRAGRRRTEIHGGGIGVTRSAAAAAAAGTATPVLAAGLALAVPHPRGHGRAVPLRSTMGGTVVGVAGLVAAITFAASLDRLTATPARWGWQADATVMNPYDHVVDALVADRRLTGITLLDRAPLRLGGASYDGHALAPLRGDVGWTIVAGRRPRAPDEVVVGLRLRRRLGVEVGDTLRAQRGRLRVVGLGVGPPLATESLGLSLLLTPEGLARVAEAGALQDALVQVSSDLDKAAVLAELRARYELNESVPPAEVANLDQLGSLPALLGVLLGAVGATALLHALALTVRRRRPELAVLKVLGFTPGQVRGAIAVVAASTAALSAMAGVPLGLGIGRVVWWAVADAIGVASDPAVPWPAVVAVTVGAPVAAALAASGPGRAAARLRPAEALRGE